MSTVVQPLPPEWLEPPTSEHRLRATFRSVGAARRARIAARAYDIYLTGRASRSSCWSRALGEDRMQQRRGDVQ